MKNKFKSGRLIKNFKWVSVGLCGITFGILIFVYGVMPALSGQAGGPTLSTKSQTPVPDNLMEQSISEKESIASRMEAAITVGNSEPARKDVRVAPELPAIKVARVSRRNFYRRTRPFLFGSSSGRESLAGQARRAICSGICRHGWRQFIPGSGHCAHHPGGSQPGSGDLVSYSGCNRICSYS